MKIFNTNCYISKSYTTSKNTIDRQYVHKVGAALVSTITSIVLYYVSSFFFTKKEFGKRFLFIQILVRRS